MKIVYDGLICLILILSSRLSVRLSTFCGSGDGQADVAYECMSFYWFMEYLLGTYHRTYQAAKLGFCYR